MTDKVSSSSGVLSLGDLLRINPKRMAQLAISRACDEKVVVRNNSHYCLSA